MKDYVSGLASTVIFLFEEGGQFPIGTAFIVGYPVPGISDSIITLIVTAKHVVGDRDKLYGRFSGKVGHLPTSVIYDLSDLRNKGDVWEHTDYGVDLLVFRTPHFEGAEYHAVPIKLIASRDSYSDEDVKATDRVIFPSLLVNFMGTSRNYPVIRDGSIALIPNELVPLKYEVGSKLIETNQQVLLIDATSIQGASGSPLFLWPGPRFKGETFQLGPVQTLLLGVMHGFYPAIPREIIDVQVSGIIPAFAENSGIAIIFPSWKLLEILERNEVVERMREVTEGK